MSFVTRFAPSPTGPLHLGHAYSAMLAHDMARAADGIFHLRMDDLDQTRARPEWEQQIYDDLEWLGLRWDGPVLRQSERTERYRAALGALWDQGLLFPCSCTRSDIQAAVSAPQEGAPLRGPDGLVYPGTCRPDTPPIGPMSDTVLRLNMTRAARDINFTEKGSERGEITAQNLVQTVGDVVLARRDMPASYHLSVVVDDADQGITHIVRGEDLSEATQIHVLLQAHLGLPTPLYHHHKLIRDDAGKRLAKRDDARAISTYRNAGVTPEEIRRMVGL